MSSSLPQTSSVVQSSITTTAKATPSAVIPSSPRLSQRPHSNAVHGALLKTAIAVPLSLLGFILLMAAIFTCRLYRHRLADESSSDAERLDLSRQSSLYSSRSGEGNNDIEKAQNIVLASVPAPAHIVSRHDIREYAGRDVGASPHKAFLMSPSLRQNPISSLDGTPNTVPAKTFRSWTHDHALEPNGRITSSSVPIRLRATPLSSSPLRHTLLRDEDDEEADE